MKGLNVRFLAILVGSAVVLGIGVFAVHYFQVRRHASFYLDKAETASARPTLAERAEAAKYYRHYLSIMSSDSEEATEARAKLGMLYAELAAGKPAEPGEPGKPGKPKEDGNPGYYHPANQTLEQVLREDETRDDVRRKLVEVAMSIGKFNDAKDHLKVLLEASPDDVELMEMMAQCQIADGKIADDVKNAAAEETLVEAIKKDPKRTESYVLLASILRHRMDRDADADAWMNKLVEANPDSAEAYCRRGEYLRMVDKSEDAEKDAAKALELAPDDRDVLLLAARCEMDKEQYDEARRHAEHAVKLFRTSADCYGVLSAIESMAGRPAAARAWLDKGLLETDEAPELLFDKARYALSAGETAKAEAIIEKLDNGRIPAPLVSHLRSWLDFVNGNWADASKGFEENRPELMKLGRWASLARHGDVLAAQCYERLSLPEKRNLALQRARGLGAVPDDATGPVAKAKALAAAGDLDAAVAEYRTAIASGGAPATAWRDVATLLYTKNMRLDDKTKRDWSEVDTALAEAAKAAPDDYQTAMLRAEVLVAQDRKSDADKLLRDALQEHTGRWNQWTALIQNVAKQDAQQAAAALDEAAGTWAKDNALLAQAKSLLDGSDRSAVTDVLARARAGHARCFDLWMALVRLAERDKNWDLAATLLADAQKQMGDSVALRAARGALLVLRGDKNASRGLDELARGADAFSAPERQDLFFRLAQLARQAGDNARALSLCQKAADAQPNNLQVWLQLFDMARAARDEAVVTKVVDEVRRIENEGPYWHYMQAVRLVSTDPAPTREALGQALDHLAQARVMRPTWAQVPMLIGHVHDRLGNTEAAINNYSEGVDQGAREVPGLTRLQQLLMAKGRASEAKNILGMLDQQKADVPYQMLIGSAQESFNEGKVEQGMAYLDRAADELRKIAADSKNHDDQLKLAGVLMAQAQVDEKNGGAESATKRYDEAEAAMRRAVELAPLEPAVRLSLVRLLHHRHKTGEAELAIADARKTLPPEKAPLALAQCYDLLGRLAEAEQQYEAAMQESPDGEGVARGAADFYLRGKEPAKGEAILKGIVEGKRKVPQNDLIWARQRLGDLVQAHRDRKQCADAIAMIDENLKANPQSVVDQRIKARLLLLQGSKKDRQDAMSLLESLVNIPQPLPRDRFELAKVLLTEQGWNAASRQMQPLLLASEVEPIWLQFCIRAQIDNGELDGAEANLRRLDQVLPNHFSVAFYRARILSKRGRHDPAIASLAAFVNAPKAEPNDRTTRLDLVAQALEEIAKPLTGPQGEEAAKKYLQQAEAYYRNFVVLRPDQEMGLVGFLGRHGKRDEAFTLLEAAAAKAEPATLASALVALVTRGTPTPEEIQQADKIQSGAIEKHGRSTALLLAMAELRIVQQRYDDAEALYREVLGAEEKNFVALNGLANFLSLRKSKLDESLSLVEKAIQLAGPLAALYDTRATVYLARGQWKEVLEDMDIALAEKSTGTRYFHQAQALFLGGQKEAALAAMKKADEAGFTVDDLQPLERPAYRQLQQDLQ